MKRMVSAKENLKSSGTWTRSLPKRRSRRDFQFALCVTSDEPDLQQRKVYKILRDAAAAKTNYLRVVDESGEDYLYPKSYFVLIKLPQKAESVLSVAS